MEPTTQKLVSEKKIAGEKVEWAYPKGNFPILLSYGFRPFFLLTPIYLTISILLWGLFWSGLLPLSFLQNPLEWHLYEMLFGVTSAMMIGFILTAVPELYEGEVPIVGKVLLGLVILWSLGRISFWLIDWLGVYVVAITNIPLILWVVFLVAKPILKDPLHRQLSLAILFLIISTMQIWFFATKLGWFDTDPMAILKASVGVFMVLVLLAARRINMEAVNHWLDQNKIDGSYMARPPRYNVAIFSVAVYTLVEFLYPNNSALSWLAFAAMAAVLNTLNDFFLDEDPVFIRPFIWPLFSMLIMMSVGYGLMGWDYLVAEVYALNHFRHLLTLGALGMAYFMVLVIVAHLHTGRDFIPNNWIGIGAFLILFSTIIRGIGIPFIENSASWGYMLSAVLWVLPFVGFLIIYGKWLKEPRVDGLPG
jgi:uncharacterized protein involved in response to NO